ncbi:MAG: HDIG domain-containing protein [Oscillospiraceae bacterium]|nr:HDIG domain-containing protein [Oscillospiraceae bacterium]
MTDLETARVLAQKVYEAGGTAYYVGGYVRDLLLGRENKDIDIEVHGITPETLTEILSAIGEPTAFGESFGIFGLRHCHLDIAMPRSEQATGPGHKDFLCKLDPFIGTYQAALRRDFTVNAMMQDILTGEIVDHFGGRQDLRDRVIRHMDAGRFAEDPLRVLRGAQFAARFGFRIAPETAKVCRQMDLSSLAPERIFGELEKALLKAERPSVFFTELRQMEQLDLWFPELKALIGVPQPPEYHPEGDIWTHTMLVTDQAAALRDQAVNPVGLMLAALCHDLGKPATTKIEEDGRLHAFGHDQAGVAVAEAFLSRITHEKKLKHYVKNMVELHMLPNMIVAQHAGKKSFNKVFDRSVCPSDLLLLCKADLYGSMAPPETYAPTEALLRERLAEYEAVMAEPFVTGADLINAGFQPGTAFHDALRYAHQLQLSGVDRKSTVSQTLSYLRRLQN